MNELFIYLFFFVFSMAQTHFYRLPMGCDCGNLRAPGFFWANGKISYSEFVANSGNLGNKTAAFYLIFLSYKIFRKVPEMAPFLFFSIYNFISTSTIFYFLSLDLPRQSALAGGVTYLILSTFSRFYINYESIEKYALLPISIIIGVSIIKNPYSGFIVGAVGPLLIYFFKPTYFLEWAFISAIQINYYQNQVEQIIAFTVSFCIIGIFNTVFRNREKKLLEMIPLLNTGLYNYWFRFRNHKVANGKKTAKSKPATDNTQLYKNINAFLMFFLPAIPGMIPIIVLIICGISLLPVKLKIILIGMFLSAVAAFIIQFRFYGYHYLTLLPSTAYVAAYVFNELHSHSLFLLSFYSIIFGLLILHIKDFFSTPEKLTSKLYTEIPHYRNRILACPYLAEKIEPDENDKILVWGDCAQLYIHTNCPSAFDYQEITQWGYRMKPFLSPQLILNCLEKSPKYIFLMIDNINFDFLHKITGLRYVRHKEVRVSNEIFPVFMLKNIDKITYYPISSLEIDHIVWDFFSKSKKLNYFSLGNFENAEQIKNISTSDDATLLKRALEDLNNKILDNLFTPCRDISENEKHRHIWNSVKSYPHW